MADHKSSIISALVSQMKTGQISKNDLFEQLSTLQRPENITSYDDDDNDNNNNNNNNNNEEDYPQTNNNNRSGKQTVSMEQFMASRETPVRGTGRDRSGSTSSRQERRELEIKMQNRCIYISAL